MTHKTALAIDDDRKSEFLSFSSDDPNSGWTEHWVLNFSDNYNKVSASGVVDHDNTDYCYGSGTITGTRVGSGGGGGGGGCFIYNIVQ